jgi:5S rRNA maturation endonuclease (ribonuclease M5)
MFDVIKRTLNIVEVLEKEMDLPFKKIGDVNYEPEDHECPFCGHKDCFRVKCTGEAEDFYHCFSCEAHGDVISFIEKSRSLKPIEAARVLVKEWKINVPNDYSPMQDIFNLAALYYHTCLKESCNKPYAELNTLTPWEYQIQTRKHKPESIDHFKLGWSDGGLVNYLKGLGFETELLEQSGLVNKKGSDFLPAKTFIYPHYVNGRVSHFTFKDPLKITAYQVRKANKLNGHTYYNSDSLKNQNTIIIVEGENDLISIHDTGWTQGLLACIGQISGEQLEWAQNYLTAKNVITIFDSDAAGDKYREKFATLRSKLASLVQVKLSGVKDIDEYLKAGGNLEAAIAQQVKVVSEIDKLRADEDVEFETEGGGSNLIEKGGAYYKIKYKEGQPFPVKLTNFTMKLRNIFVRGGDREREIIVTREDGKISHPIVVSSESKISLKPFKTLLANASDASYYGQESDLTAIWEHVYKQTEEKLVHVPLLVGKLDEFDGWMFRDIFITNNGDIIKPDDEGIFWVNEKERIGIKPISLDVENSGKRNQENADIPHLVSDWDEDEREKFTQEFVTHLAKNLGDEGMALIILGWAKSNVYSNQIFKAINGFPFLHFSGTHGKGKSSLIKWILNLYNMEKPGYHTLPQLKSGVGFSRKIAYYSSLPVGLDEFRNSKDAQELFGSIRAWYNRSGRTMGIKDSFGVREQAVVSNFMFAGQDEFSDSATRERCIPIRISPHNRELKYSWKWIESNKESLGVIGFHWIMESTKRRTKDVMAEWEKLDHLLADNKCPARKSKNWATVGLFGKEIGDRYLPKFNFMEYLLKVTREDVEEFSQEAGDDICDAFFRLIEGIQAQENSRLSGEHIKKEGNKLLIWFDEVFQIVTEERRLSREFTDRAIRNAIKEEPYFIGQDRKPMGIKEARRRVMVLDLAVAPNTVKNIGLSSG